MEKFVLLFILGCCIVGVNGQIGVTGCTAGTQANCPNFLPNSYCNLGTLLCECPAGYVASTTNTACEYECGALAAPDNGAVDTSAGTVAGSVATFSCVSMYKLSGSATSTCVDSTGWDNTATTCVPAELGDSCATNIFQCNNIVNGQCLAFSTCECQAGYEDDGTGYACTEIDECASNPCQNGGTCVDALNSYSCNCVAGYMDTNCETDINECAGNPCQNGGTCTDGINSYTCACVAGFDGNDCENNINECSSNPCQNGGTCLDGTNAYICSCVAGYMGTNCETNINECDPNLCQNGATCVDGISQYTCTCVAGYDGNNCENNIDECVGNACTNGATCVDGINQYTCNCVAGYDGEFCGNNIDECASHACQNSATCVDGINTYTCVCPSGYDGEFCNNNIDECAQDPCINGGTCIDEVNDYTCNCVTGYTGKTCATNIDDCAANPCQNGATCLDDVNDYSCVCVAGYTDKNCDTDIDECANHICQNGATCVDNIDGYTCLCAPGYDGTYCVDDIDECENHNCQNGAICIDGIDGYTCDCVNGYDGTFCQNNINECASHSCLNGATCVDGIDVYTCNCVDGYTGEFCATDIDECSSHACVNGATCVDAVNLYTCDCVTGYTGTFCETNIDECDPDPCQNGATCVDNVNDYTCNCVDGYTDKNCQTNIDECNPDPCQNGATCVDMINDYTCNCVAGYEGKNCGTNIDECDSDPCQNGGTCTDEVNQYTCICVPGYNGDECENNIDECNGNLCENGATCVDGINLYTCDCVPGYDGVYCGNDIDECASHNCLNGATCIDEINTYNCLCVTGYTDQYCQTDIDECASHACQNGATCVDGIKTYICVCPSGYDGDFCNSNIDECTQDPCINGGTCIDEVNDYTCNCVTGYADKTCATNIDDCAANPCQNGATCLDAVDDYSCVCAAGYTDKNCDTDIDECANHICQNGATCADIIDGYTCLCAPGFEGTYCVDDIDECENHNCQNDAICIDGIDGYTCDCVNGYEGTFCQNNINECAGHSCLNGATCVDGINEYTCTCVDGYTGEFCATDIDECSSHACVNGATCVDAINLYTCDCVTGYTGTFCETNIDECDPDPCQNGATCVDNVNDYTCNCVDGYTDKNCQTNIDECDPDPCQNGATCVDNVNDYTCNCVAGYEGKNCGTNIDECDSDPCQNGGTCTDEVNQYTCTCVPGYNGDECENNIDECNGNLCENGATCVDGINLYTCDCVPGYDGTYCGNDKDECASHNCLNGATCNDEINTYSCICVTGYTDQYCQTDINECASTPCDNGGSCTDLVNGFECSCANGFTGLICRAGELGDDCSTRAEVCADLANAECDGSTCVCITGYEDPTGATGTCSRVDCGTVTPPVDGTVDHGEGTLYESKAYFSCNAGYTLTGVSSVTCQADATWDGTAPTCVIKDCGTLATPLNGNLQYTPNTEYLGLAEFSCITGYTLMGDATRTCQDTGVWGGTNPICQINDCGTTVAPANGGVDLTDGTTYESVIVFQCDNGYDLVGQSSLECQADSNWDASKPTCNIKDCGFLSDPTNGAVDHADGTTYLAEAVFSCDTGYTLIGTSSRICQASGSWSGSSDPYCQINDCEPLTAILNGESVLYDTTNSTFGATATVTCDTGYIANTTNITCLASGKWEVAKCSVVDCKNVPDVPQGTAVLFEEGNTTYGAYAAVICETGYNASMGTVQCLEAGRWENSTCDLIDCKAIPEVAAGSITLFKEGNITYGALAEVTCAKGYNTTLHIIQCLETGDWEIPSCDVIDCNDVPDITKGTVTPVEDSNTTYGALANVICDNGYNASSTTIQCLDTGKWEVTTCEIVDCGSLTVPTNGKLDSSTGTTYNSIVKFRCDDGYTIEGSATNVCVFNGSWSAQSPTCLIKDCGGLQDPVNGWVQTSDGTTYKAEAVYNCNGGYTLNGRKSRVCLANGLWSFSAPKCTQTVSEINTCAANEDSRGTTWPETNSGNTIDKSCNSRFTGLITRHCRSDGTWQLPQYNCVRESVKEVEEKVFALNVNASENDVSDVLLEINKVTVKNESTRAEDRLTDGELNVLSSSLETVAELLVALAGIINDDITEDFLESASNLIDDSNQESWQSLSESGSSGAEKVLIAVDTMAKALSQSIGSSEKNKTIIVKKNIAIEVKKFSNEGFIFPNPAENEHGEDDDDTQWLTESQSRLQLDTKSLKNDTVKYVTTAVIYRDMSEILPTKQTNFTSENSDDVESDEEEVVINSPILSLTIHPPVSEKLNPPITFTFEHDSTNFTGPSCVFWSFQSSGSGPGFWSTDGCAVNTTNKNFTVCQCEHLTNFAVLMSPFKEADATSDALRIISMVGIGISIACLIVTLVLHFCLWKYLRNDRTTALMNLCVALLISYIIFLAGVDRTESTAACAAIAAVIQYIYLVVFCIMLVEGIELAVIVLYVFKTKSRIKIMLVLAWVIPAVIVGISLGVSKLEGYGNENFCWLSVDNGLIWAFVGPALLIITFNGICLIIVMRVMFQTKSMETKTASEKIKTSFRSLCVLVPVLGLSWILGVFYMGDSFYFVQYIFAILNGLQGFFIFLFHCLLDRQVKKALMLRERRRLSAKETLKSTVRSTSREERKSKDLRDTDKTLVDSGEFAQETSNDSKDKILQPYFSQQEVKFSTPLGFYGNGRRAATFNAESHNKLTSSRSYSRCSQNVSDQLQTNILSARL